MTIKMMMRSKINKARVKKRARLSERSKKCYGGRSEIDTTKKGRDVTKNRHS